MSKRIEYLDVAKGLGILFIVLGHSKLPDILLSWIYSFHVPLFFIISGYLYKPRPIFEIVKKGFKQLVKPMFLTNLVCVLGLMVVFSHSGTWLGPKLGNWILNSFLMINKEEFAGMWFLCALFWAKIWLKLLLRFCGKFLISSSILLFLMTMQLWLNIGEVPWFFLHGMACSLFLTIGYILKNTNFIDYKSHYEVSLLCLFIVFYAYKLPMDVNLFNYPNGLFSVISSTCISLAFLFLLKIFCGIKHVTGIKNLIMWIGENTLIILCFHVMLHYWQIQKYVTFLHPYWVGIFEFVVILLCVIVVNKNKVVYKIYHA